MLPKFLYFPLPTVRITVLFLHFLLEYRENVEQFNLKTKKSA